MTDVETTAHTPRGPGRDFAGKDFGQAAETYRRELKLHCYRMLGSLHEAEDMVQETYLRAWRSLDDFDGHGSLRAWLYKIATNACLNLIARRKITRRVLPDQKAPAAETVQAPGAPATDIAWLEPYPDAEIETVADDAPNPEARYAAHEAVKLAFVAAIQQLPPRQRAVVLLCDVLGWSAAESAALLGSSNASINSALQRARDTLARQYPSGRPDSQGAAQSDQQELLDRYLRAWEGHDIDAFVAVLKDDAAFTMPPWLLWYIGGDKIGAFFTKAWKTCHGLRLVPTLANHQPAFAVYERVTDGAPMTAHSIHVLELDGGRVSRLTMFLGALDHLFPAFGLPLTLPN